MTRGARGRAVAPLAAALAAVAPLAPLVAQSPPADAHGRHVAAARAAPGDDWSGQPAAERDFLAAARAGTARYRELPAAIADGYRRLGGELPSMGEHWLHNGRALADTLAPGAPPILVYVRVAGRPVLAGVAYTRFVAPGAPYPPFPSGQPHAWHDHNGSVDTEVLPLGHAASPRPTRAAKRIAVMHAWVGVPNPAGVWAANNWALAYVRAGLPPDAGPGAADARALALASGGGAYYLRAITSAGGLGAAEEAQVRAIVAGRAGESAALAALLAAAVRAGRRPAGRAPEVDALAALWSGLWESVEGAVRPEVRARLRAVRAALDGEG